MMVQPKSKLCMFCGRDKRFGKMNKEHFVPKGLWATSRPNGTITLPAHVACNDEFASDNEYFRDVLIAEQHVWSHPEAKSVYEGKITRKMDHHLGAVIKTLKNLRMIDVYSSGGLLLGQRPVFEVDNERINRVLCNIVKGIFYVTKDRPVSTNCSVSILSQETLRNADVRKLIDGMGPINHFGDDVFQCRTTCDLSNEDNFACLMRFYGARTYFGVVSQNLE